MAILDNLAPYYKLDETTGNTVVDAVGTYGGTGNNITWTTGKINNGASFNGSSSYINFSNPGITGAFSFACWFNTNTSNAGAFIGVQTNPGSGCPYVGLTTGNEVFLVKSQTAVIGTSSGFGVATGTWYHLVVTYDGTAYKFYKNGNYLSGGNNTQTFSTTYNISLGKEQSGGYYNGLMDEVGVWKRELTSLEVTTLYNGGSGIQYPFTSTANTTNFLQFF